MISGAEVTRRLASAGVLVRDNVAQKLIQESTDAELRALDAEAVIRLLEALTKGTFNWVSGLDRSAVERLRKHSRFQPIGALPEHSVNLVRWATPTQAAAPLLSADLIRRLYGAEASRLSTLEKMGIDGSSIGRGQLTQASYDDVRKASAYAKELLECITTVALSSWLLGGSAEGLTLSDVIRSGTYRVEAPSSYGDVYRCAAVEDLVVAAYLAIRIKTAIKPGRKPMDALRFGVAVYHGMFTMVSDAQKTAGNDIDWDPVEKVLLASGSPAKIDGVRYVKEVVP